jgi:hypothetical protein
MPARMTILLGNDRLQPESVFNEAEPSDSRSMSNLERENRDHLCRPGVVIPS